jgi:hypothetical protein
VRELGPDDVEALRRTCLAVLRAETGAAAAGQGGASRKRSQPAARRSRRAEEGLLPEIRAIDVANATGLSRPSAGALVARLVTKRVLRPTHEDHTGHYHAIAGHVSVALEAALTT